MIKNLVHALLKNVENHSNWIVKTGFKLDTISNMCDNPIKYCVASIIRTIFFSI